MIGEVGQLQRRHPVIAQYLENELTTIAPDAAGESLAHVGGPRWAP